MDEEKHVTPLTLISFKTLSSTSSRELQEEKCISEPTNVETIELSLANLNASHTGEYILRLTVADDKTEDVSFRLNVRLPPDIELYVTSSLNNSAKLDPRFLQRNESYVVHCHVVGYVVSDVTFDWSEGCVQQNRLSIDHTSIDECRRWISVDQSKDNGDQPREIRGYVDIDYTSKTRAQSTGAYRCSVGQHEKLIDYVVVDTPKAQENKGIYVDSLREDHFGNREENPIEIFEHDKIILRCRTQKYAYQKPTWEKIDNWQSNRYTLKYNANGSIYSNSLELIFQSITLADAGNYSCLIKENNSTNQISEKINIRVTKTEKPDFGYLSSNLTLEANVSSPLEIRCDAKGVPQPKIEWLRNNQSILNNHIELTENNTLLKIGRLIKQDQGTYTCKLTNKVGVATRNYTLIILGVDEPATSGFKSTISISAMVVLAIIVLILVALMIKHKLNDKERIRLLKQMYRQLMLSAENSPPRLNSNLPVNQQIEKLPYDRRFEIPRDHIRVLIEEPLGEGEFGKVFKGRNTPLGAKSTTVAVKMPKNGKDIQHQQSLLSELKMMIHVGHHINVLRLIGAVTKRMDSGELFLVTEYCKNGSLEKYLKQRRPLFVDEIVPRYEKKNGNVVNKQSNNDLYVAPDRFGRVAALGVHDDTRTIYKVIHRDLAVRNILITDDQLIKISDFGLARHDEKYKANPNTPLPIKWMALESLQTGEFTVESDVWSFGILMWEIFALAETPYSNHFSDQNFVQFLQTGGRLDRPKYAPAEIYRLMLECWHQDPSIRPTFLDCQNVVGRQMAFCCPNILEHLQKNLRLNTTDTDSTRRGYPYRPESALVGQNSVTSDFSTAPLLQADQDIKMKLLVGRKSQKPILQASRA